jgi:Tfp pilus assembly protein PilO
MTPVKRIFAEKRRLIMPLLVAIAANVALYALAIYPLERRVATAGTRAEAAAAARRAAESNHLDAQATVIGMDRADEELQRFYKSVLPADQTGARRITYVRLARMARESGLRTERGTIESSAIDDSRLSRLRMTMTLEGQYDEIRRFIHRIETAPEFTVIEDVAVQRGVDEEGSSLVLELAVTTYYWTNGRGD